MSGSSHLSTVHLWRVWFHVLSSFQLGDGRQQKGLIFPSSIPASYLFICLFIALSVSPCMILYMSLWPSWWCSSRLAAVCQCLWYTGEHKTDCSTLLTHVQLLSLNSPDLLEEQLLASCLQPALLRGLIPSLMQDLHLGSQMHLLLWNLVSFL